MQIYCFFLTYARKMQKKSSHKRNSVIVAHNKQSIRQERCVRIKSRGFPMWICDAVSYGATPSCRAMRLYFRHWLPTITASIPQSAISIAGLSICQCRKERTSLRSSPPSKSIGYTRLSSSIQKSPVKGLSGVESGARTHDSRKRLSVFVTCWISAV